MPPQRRSRGAQIPDCPLAGEDGRPTDVNLRLRQILLVHDVVVTDEVEEFLVSDRWPIVAARDQINEDLLELSEIFFQDNADFLHFDVVLNDTAGAPVAQVSLQGRG